MKKANIKPLQSFLAEFLGAQVTIPEPVDGEQAMGKLEAKRLAQRIADQFEDASRAAKRDGFTETQARKVIADIYETVNTKKLSSSTIADFLYFWLTRKQLEAGEKTHQKYTGVVRQFRTYLGTKADWDISRLTAAEITGFRDDLSRRLTIGTTNVAIKILRSALAQAYRDGLPPKKRTCCPRPRSPAPTIPDAKNCPSTWSGAKRSSPAGHKRRTRTG